MSHSSPSYALTIRLRYPDQPGQLGHITTVIGEAQGMIGAVDVVNARDGLITRDITVNAVDVDHGRRIVEAVKGVEGVRIVNVSDRVFLMHLGGKIEIAAKTPIKTRDDLSMAYTPGVARICRSIYQDPEASFALTIRKDTVAVTTDGSATALASEVSRRRQKPAYQIT